MAWVHGTTRWIATAAASFGALAALSGACTSSGTDFPPSTATTSGSGAATGSGSMAQGTGGASSSSTNAGGASSTSSSSANGGAGGGAMVECKANGDCDAKLGAAACGNWLCDMAGKCQISAPNCTDADHDGYGAGAMCMCSGLDCDDNDPKVKDSSQRACYDGPMGSSGKGVCHDGAQTCTKGLWGPCVGEVTPSGEACNNLDDDCNGNPDDNLGTFTCGIGECVNTIQACSGGKLNQCVPKNPPSQIDGAGNVNCDGKDNDCDGQIDEDCVNLCIHVSPATNMPAGNDATADGSTGKPFLSIQAAINYAANNNGPKTVCVSGGMACNQNATYANQANQTITMADGVNVLGSYEATTWTQCGGLTTTIQPKTGAGVTFPNTVKKSTTLGSFQIDRFNTANTAAITVDGAKLATVTTCLVSFIQNNQVVTNSYGINVINGGDLTVTRSRVEASLGTSESIALRSVGSKVWVVNNCSAPLDANGRCPQGCGGGAYFRGRSQPGTGATYGVLLDNSPGSKVESTSMCQVNADIGALIKVQNDGTGVLIRANNIIAFGGAQHSHGVWVEDCMGAKPWITDNFQIVSNGQQGNSQTDGVRAIGDCHPTIDKNVLIGGGGEGAAGNPNGVHCGPNAKNVASKCIVVGNTRIAGSAFGFPPVATGVRCDGGSCLRIEQNLITGRGGTVSHGVFLQQSGAYIDNNEIRGGCSPTSTGVTSVDSYARIQNNRIFGWLLADCNGGQAGNLSFSTGVHSTTASSLNELDVHSNDIDGAGSNNNAFSCTSRGVDLDVGNMPPAGGKGIFRNNIIRGGVCNMRREGVREALVGADPRLFEHNDLDPFMAPQALYLDEGMTALTTAAAVDALKDMTVNGTLSADCLFVNYPTDLHISATSMCKGGGTATGAPAKDMDGQPRAATPAIGADEP